jgi:transitional endoplasmic reticulum ATPase
MATAVKEAPKDKWASIDVKIAHEGEKIILPNLPSKMETDDAINLLKRYQKAEEQEYDVVEMVRGAPWDALTALTRAMQQKYGVVIAQSIQTFFGEIKPVLQSVTVGPNGQTIQVATGQMSLPGIRNPVQINLHHEGAYIRGTVRPVEKKALIEIRLLAEQILRTDSIYKGQAILFDVDEDGDLQLTVQPEFIDLKAVKESDMIHTKTTSSMIRINVLAPLKHTAACRVNKTPLKRGVLLAGKYGTGKTLTARVTAKVATDNGWTFIMLNRAQGLKAAIQFAKNYQPCVIFAEDIDRAADREEESVNDLVNTLDGLINKNDEIMTVLTTNFIEKIDRALLRPGRFDALITIEPPDAETAIRVAKFYAQDLLPSDADFTYLGEQLAGKIPAIIREVVERAKLGMLSEDRDSLTVEDLEIANAGMDEHLRHLNGPPTEKSDAEQFYDCWLKLMNNAEFGGGDGAANLSSGITNINQLLRRTKQDIMTSLVTVNDSAKGAGGAAMEAKKLAIQILDKVS